MIYPSKIKEENSALFWKNKGNEYYKSHRYRKAIACYDKALDLDPDYQDALHNKCMALLKLGRTKEADIISSKLVIIPQRKSYNPDHEQNYHFGTNLIKSVEDEDAKKISNKCDICDNIEILFHCNFCEGHFCVDHHLPPNHNCPNIESFNKCPPPAVAIDFSANGTFSAEEGGKRY